MAQTLPSARHCGAHSNLPDRGTGWTARALFRDYDGVTRQVERVGRTDAAVASTVVVSELPAGVRGVVS